TRPCWLKASRRSWTSPRPSSRLAAAPTLNPDKGPAIDRLDREAVTEAPPDQIVAPKESHQPWLSPKGCRIGFAERDAANRRLAQLGEEFVLILEWQRLRAAGRDDLAQ